MPRKKQAKNESMLDEAWVAEVSGETNDRLDRRLRDIVVNQYVLAQAYKVDPDLQQARDRVATATEMYRGAKKLSGEQVSFIVELLRGRGVAVPSIQDFLKSDPEAK